MNLERRPKRYENALRLGASEGGKQVKRNANIKRRSDKQRSCRVRCCAHTRQYIREQYGDRSEKGASITIALFLFLICAVLASVVLAAATTTAGRATTLKDSEQSYYAVTSAAKLFREKLDGQSVVIEQTEVRTDQIKTVYTNPSGDSAGQNTITRFNNVGGNVTHTLKIDGAETLYKGASGTDNAATLLRLSALNKLDPSSISAGSPLQLENYASSVWGTEFVSAGSSDISGMSFEVDAQGFSNVVKDALTVKVDQMILPDGSIRLTFYKDAKDTGYQLELLLTADVNVKARTDEIPQSSDVTTTSTGYERVEVVSVTETHWTTVTWHASSLVAARGIGGSP